MVETVCQQRRGAKEGKEVWLYSSQLEKFTNRPTETMKKKLNNSFFKIWGLRWGLCTMKPQYLKK